MFIGYWADKKGGFYGGKTNIIKEDGTWTVPGNHEDGIAWWNHKGTVNLKRSVQGSNDHHAVFDGTNLEVTRQSDGVKWTLERV